MLIFSFSAKATPTPSWNQLPSLTLPLVFTPCCGLMSSNDSSKL